MANLNNLNSREGKSSITQLFQDTCGLAPVRLSPTKGDTILRFVPQIGEDGTILPMCAGTTPAGPDWSNFEVHNVSTNAGISTKFTVINEPVDVPNLDAINQPFTGAYIKLKHMQKSRKVPDHMRSQVEDVFSEEKDERSGGKKSGPLPQGKDTVFGQAIVHTLHGTVLPKLAPRQAVVMSSTTAQAVNGVLRTAHEQGLDLFSPAGGRCIRLKATKQIGNDRVIVYTAEIGDPMPLSPEQCKKLWVPWEKVFVRYTREQLFEMAIQALGEDLMHLAFSMEVEAWRRARAPVAQQPARPAAAPTQPQAAPAASAQPQTAAAVGSLVELDLDSPTQVLDGGDDAPSATKSANPPAALGGLAETNAAYQQMMAELDMPE